MCFDIESSSHALDAWIFAVGVSIVSKDTGEVLETKCWYIRPSPEDYYNAMDAASISPIHAITAEYKNYFDPCCWFTFWRQHQDVLASQMDEVHKTLQRTAETWIEIADYCSLIYNKYDCELAGDCLDYDLCLMHMRFKRYLQPSNFIWQFGLRWQKLEQHFPSTWSEIDIPITETRSFGRIRLPYEDPWSQISKMPDDEKRAILAVHAEKTRSCKDHHAADDATKIAVLAYLLTPSQDDLAKLKPKTAY